MRNKLTVALAVCLLMPTLAYGQDAKAVLDGATKAMGDVKSLQYTGSGAYFFLGQSVTPGAPWPRFNLKPFTRTINYETPAMRDKFVRSQADPNARGGGIPMTGEQKQMQAVSGNLAWSQTEPNPPGPALTAVGERLHQLWITPHGIIKAAAANNATAQARADGGKKLTVLSLTVPGQFSAKAYVNDKNLVEKVESWTTNPVLGDISTETLYSDYKDFGGVQFPTRITQKAGGHPTLDLTISEVKAGVAADIQPPDNVRQAAVKVDADKVADGVWYLTGGTHHSVLIEMKDRLILVEAPQDDARSAAIIAEAKKLVPNKPIKTVVNSHHHFDHAGGLGTFVAEGATIVTHDGNKAFFEQSLAAPRKVQPDKLAQSGKKPAVEGMGEKRVLSDGTRNVELHLIKDTPHGDGLIMAYLPQEKLLIEADAYTPGAPNAAPPSTPNPASVNLYDNIERLKLAVDQILPLDGRKVPFADLQKWIGKSS